MGEWKPLGLMKCCALSGFVGTSVEGRKVSVEGVFRDILEDKKVLLIWIKKEGHLW